ncbi:MAG: MFS transporter [Pseudomonadales bacterium]|nr:MFS transporter [Pseudomonadales bacterium]
MKHNQLSFRHKVYYAMPEIAFASVIAPVAGILPTLYAKHAMLSVAATGLIFLVMRIFDGVTDPLIGYLSDRTRTRIGARKPWIIVGGVLVMVSVFFLFRIPPDAGAGYFGAWALLYYLGNTMYAVPHMAWGSEIIEDYNQRALVFSFRSIASECGTLTYTLLPLLLFYFGVVRSTEFTPEVIRWLAYVVLVTFPVLITLNVLLAPVGHLAPPERTTIKGVYSAVLHNAPLLRFLSAYVLAGAGYGFFAALFFPFLDSYMQLGDKVPVLIISMSLSALISLPVWVHVVSRVGKHRAWAYGWIINSLCLLPLAFVSPGESALYLVLLCFSVYGFSNGVSAIAPFALMADIVDYDILKTGVDRAGSFYAFLYLTAKLTAAIGGFALVILGMFFGYQLEEGVVNTSFSNMGIVILFCVVSGALQLTAIPLIWNFPINKRRHDIIRKRISQRLERAAHLQH